MVACLRCGAACDERVTIRGGKVLADPGLCEIGDPQEPYFEDCERADVLACGEEGTGPYIPLRAVVVPEELAGMGSLYGFRMHRCAPREAV